MTEPMTPAEIATNLSRPYPCSVSTAKLSAALAKAQAAFLPAKKDNKATIEGREGKRGYSYNYADFSEIVAATRPALTANGLSVSHVTVVREGTIFVVCTLEHESGEWKSSEWPMANLPQIQTMGSLYSYLRRYSYQGIVGLMPEDEDDDGAGANQHDTGWKKPAPKSKAENGSRPLPDAAKQRIMAAAVKAGKGGDALLPILQNIGGWGKLDEVPIEEVQNVVDTLEGMARK